MMFDMWGWLSVVSSLLWVAFIAVVFAAAVVFLRRALSGGPSAAGSAHALQILEERYARGEIDRDEFFERRRVLLEER